MDYFYDKKTIQNFINSPPVSCSILPLCPLRGCVGVQPHLPRVYPTQVRVSSEAAPKEP